MGRIGKPSFFRKVKAVEREFDEPFPEVIRGFVKQGETLYSTAGILEMSPADLRRYARKIGVKQTRRTPVRSLAHEPTVKAKANRKRGMRDRCRNCPRRGYRDRIEYKGKFMMPVEVAEQIGYTGQDARRVANAICQRMRRGKDPQTAATVPLEHRSK